MLAPKCTLQGLRNTLTVSSESTKHKEQCIYYYLTKETTTARIAMCLEPSLAATLKSLNCNPVASNSFLKKKQLQNDKKLYIYNSSLFSETLRPCQPHEIVADFPQSIFNIAICPTHTCGGAAIGCVAWDNWENTMRPNVSLQRLYANECVTMLPFTRLYYMSPPQTAQEPVFAERPAWHC